MTSTTTTIKTAHDDEVAVGLSVPPFTPHAISVSLPRWRDNVGYEEGEKRVVDSMVSGYPRFFIHLSIQKLARYCELKYALGKERCMLFPTQKIADHCRSFIQTRSAFLATINGNVTRNIVEPRVVHLLISPEDKFHIGEDQKHQQANLNTANLHIVLFPADTLPVAKEFWQHTGLGISSRLADYCLSMLPDDSAPPQLSPTSPLGGRFPSKKQNKHYSKKSISKTAAPPCNTISSDWGDCLEDEHALYLEEHYGRNLPRGAASIAKHALRRRISGVLVRDDMSDCAGGPCAGDEDFAVGPSSRGIPTVTEDDVYLYPTGMSAIWNAHRLALSVLPPAKSVCFGFPYTDTLKILQKWGPGCHFFGLGVDSDIDALAELLEQLRAQDPKKPPILALFTEFPSNPLLRSANLPRLRALADKYDFLLVIDETIGNFVNVEVLPYADIVVSSLSKVFSGGSNVMGGNLVLNPSGTHYTRLKAHLEQTYEDTYFGEDAIFMERNSRDFQRRIKVIDRNAESICDFLRSRSVVAAVANSTTATNTSFSPAIKEVFYPKFITRENYDICRIKESGGFGGLFSLTFTSMEASRAFFDGLGCFKGPSLGTNFTLACPFTILAHYAELDWAAEFGVEQGLVRVSVGMEDTATLLRIFEKALEAAETATASALE